MRRFFSSILLLTYIGFFTLSPFVSAQGAPVGDATQTFELTVPSTARANEAFSVTVKALNADGTPNTTYTGTIDFLVELGGVGNPTGAEFPHNVDSDTGEGYQFTLSDQGQHTFTTFTFPSAGDYAIAVIDESDYKEKVRKSITVTAAGTPITPTETVTITEPVSQMTVNTSTVAVVGTTTATRTVKISVNGTPQGSATTNTEGGFQSTVTLSAEGNNTITVDVLDGTPAIVGTSSVTVRYLLDAPKITSLTLKEGNQVFAGSIVNIEAIGDQGLKTVVVKFGDKDVVLEEDISRLGTYTGKTQLSSFEGEMKPVVSVESFLGTKADFPNLYTINIIASAFENVKAEWTADKKARFTFSLKPDLEEIKYFKIKYGNKTGIYDKDVTTYEKTQIKAGTQYTWFIPGLSEGEYFSTIIALDKDKNELAISSGEQTFVASLGAASTCYIDKVSGVTVKTSGKVSLISWDKLADAATYQIFKKDASGEYAMIDEVTDNSYKINIDMTLEEEVFEDFQIRATCKNGDITGEGAYSESVAVQTGPVAIMFMLFMIASGTAFILMRRGYLK